MNENELKTIETAGQRTMDALHLKRENDELRVALRNAMSWVNFFHDAVAETMKAEAKRLLGD